MSLSSPGARWSAARAPYDGDVADGGGRALWEIWAPSGAALPAVGSATVLGPALKPPAALMVPVPGARDPGRARWRR